MNKQLPAIGYISGSNDAPLPRINVANVYYHIIMTVYCRKRRRLLIADSVAYIKVVVRRFIIHASRQVNKVRIIYGVNDCDEIFFFKLLRASID